MSRNFGRNFKHNRWNGQKKRQRALSIPNFASSYRDNTHSSDESLVDSADSESDSEPETDSSSAST